MIKLSINLPGKKRLSINFGDRRRTAGEKTLLPNLGKILNAYKGSKISRYFRHIFEQSRIKKLLGANLAIAFFATSLIPATGEINPGEYTQVIANTPVVLTTQITTRYPVDEINITQGYTFYHPAYDLDGITGDPIYPIMNGTITAVGYSRLGYGNAVLISHNDDLTSLYAHLSEILVTEGQEVTTKDVIGNMGATGRSWGDHLHLEIRKVGRPINPDTILNIN